MKKIMVVMGGMSSERKISLMSGSNVAKALEQGGYKVVTHELTSDVSGLMVALEREKPDVVFNALHGKYGEDGCIQGLLNMMKIPYTHSGVLASAIGMDKAMTRQLVGQIGVPVAEGGLMTRNEFLEQIPPMPYVIKPNDEGSSVGVCIVRTKEDQEAALEQWKDGEEMLVEAYIPGRELSVAVLDGLALGAVEIVPKTGYYDYNNKYTDGAADHIIPANIPADIYQRVARMAEQVHLALECRGVSRSDFRLDETNPQDPKLVFLEINTNPGMTSLSLVPEIAKKCQQMTYEQLVSHLVEEAACDG